MDAALESRGQQGLPSSMSRFSRSKVAFAATSSKLDKDLQDDKVRVRHAIATRSAKWHVT
jgi:hypothetical protein